MFEVSLEMSHATGRSRIASLFFVRLSVCALSACTFAGCGSSEAFDPYRCASQAECVGRELCVNGRCQVPERGDASLGLPDASASGEDASVPDAAVECTPYVSGPIVLDYLQHCRTDQANAFVLASQLPAGNYLLRALPSGATVWRGPWMPPATGWSYSITCAGLDPGALNRVRTPVGARYLTPEDAYAALLSQTATTAFAGGDLRCGIRDTACTDNSGSIRWQMERTCP